MKKKGKKKAYDPIENSRHRKRPKSDAIAAKLGLLLDEEEGTRDKPAKRKKA